MIQYIFSLALLLGSLLMGSCVSTVEELEEKAAPISFATTMTRAAVDADKKGMENFLVWGGFDNQNNLFNAESVTSNGVYQGTRYWVPGKIHNFYALHPAGLTNNAQCTNDGVITITGFNTSERKGASAIDLMTARATNLDGTNPQPVNLTFSHELSRVRFTISTDSKVTITSVKLWGVYYLGDFTTQPDAANQWSKLTQAVEGNTPFIQDKDFVLEANGSRHLLAGDYDANNDNYGDLLLIPQQLPTTENTPTPVFFMTWTNENGTVKKVQVPLHMVGPDIWEKGKSYHYQATIPSPSTDITFTVTIGDWNEKRIDADL